MNQYRNIINVFRIAKKVDKPVLIHAVTLKGKGYQFAEDDPKSFHGIGKFDPETGLCPLGDMAISLERAVSQAKEFGHSVRREVGYLTIHSMLHLLGYDHLDEGSQKAQMRAREETIAATIYRMQR